MNGTCTYEWEVYAFEASPIMHPFVEAFVKFLNGKGPRPSLTVPPVGGSIQMLEYARRFGCPSRHVRSEYPKMYECMNRVFSKAYAAFKVDPALNDTALIQRRLDEAAQPNVASSTRFTFVPAAVGASASALEMSWPYGVILTTDMHNLAAGVPVPAGVPAGARVQVVDFVSWFGERFKKSDLVIVKMDVEGAEHQIVKRMANSGLLESIDVLGLECHGPHDRCSALTRTVTQHGVRMVSEAASSGLMGVDPYSHPKDMMPIDPRPRASLT